MPLTLTPEDGDLIVLQANTRLGEQLADLIEQQSGATLSDSEYDALSQTLQDDGTVAAVGKFVRP